jgi:hypothetical protein
MSHRYGTSRSALEVAALAFTRLVIATNILATVACGPTTSDDPVGAIPPAEVSGTYRLASVNGVAVPTTGLGAVLAGEIVLSADGRATRMIRYQLSGVAAERDFVSSGTFSATSDSIVFALIEDSTRPDLVWRPRASLASGTITLRYINPADGPDILEVYRLQAR